MHIFLLLLLCLSSLVAEAQRALPDTRLDGRIDEINEDDGYIIVGGERIAYNDTLVTVVYRDQELDPTFLETGYRIAYELAEDDSVSRIVILTPLVGENDPFNN